MKRSILALSILTAASLPLGLHAKEKNAAPEAAVSTQYNTITAKVLEVDQATHKLTLENDVGVRTVLKVDPTKVKNFKNIKKGDLVKVEQIESMAISLTKKEKGEKPSVDVVTEKSTAPMGSKPSADIVETSQITAEVVKVDLAKSMVELKGPAGNILALKAKDPKNLEGLKKGDMIAATYTEATAISVEAMPTK